jgi:hypothetical protein
MVKYSKKRSGRKKRYSKRRYSKKRYSKKRYSKRRYSKRLTQKGGGGDKEEDLSAMRLKLEMMTERAKKQRTLEGQRKHLDAMEKRAREKIGAEEGGTEKLGPGGAPSLTSSAPRQPDLSADPHIKGTGDPESDWESLKFTLDEKLSKAAQLFRTFRDGNPWDRVYGNLREYDGSKVINAYQEIINFIDMMTLPGHHNSQLRQEIEGYKAENEWISDVIDEVKKLEEERIELKEKNYKYGHQVRHRHPEYGYTWFGKGPPPAMPSKPTRVDRLKGAMASAVRSLT